jgi:hypothetical protein
MFTFETSPKVGSGFFFSLRSCQHDHQAGSCSRSQVSIAGSHEVNTSFDVTFFISDIRSAMLAVVLHEVTQQVSSTLKFFKPFCTSVLINKLRSWMKPDNRFCAKSD